MGEENLDEVNPKVVEKLNSLSPEEQRILILEVTDYSAGLINGHKRILKRESLYTADDLAMEAIQRVFDGRRKWNPDKDPDFSAYLRSVVKSIYNREVTERIKKEKVFEPTVDSPNPVDSVPTKLSSPLEDLEYKEAKKRIYGLFEKEEEQLVLLCLFEGIDKPADIAKQLNVDVKEIYRINRNIERRLLRKNKGVSI